MLSAKSADSAPQLSTDEQETPLLLSVPQAARLLGIGISLGWTLVYNGELPSVRLGRRVLVPRTAVEQLAHASKSA